MNRKTRCLLALLLLSYPSRILAQADEFPIGAWFPGLFNNQSGQHVTRLNLVRDAHFNVIHAHMPGHNPTTRRAIPTGHSAAQNKAWDGPGSRPQPRFEGTAKQLAPAGRLARA